MVAAASLGGFAAPLIICTGVSVKFDATPTVINYNQLVLTQNSPGLAVTTALVCVVLS